MQNPKNMLLAVVVISIVIVSNLILFRYELVAINNGDSFGAAYRLDRWSGEIEFITGPEKTPVIYDVKQ